MMTEELLDTKSPFPYQIAIFIFLNIWGFMSFEVAQYQLTILYEAPLAWIGWSNLVLLSLLPALGVSAWMLKDRIQLRVPKWNFRIREVGFKEFREMVANYNSNYRYLLSSFDYLVLLATFICYALVVGLPFFLMRTTVLIIQMTPILVALLTIVYGLLFSFFIFKYMPNEATPEFPFHNSRVLQKSIRFLTGIPGIFWVGVQLTIGESGGFYTLRNPISIARIEGIEGVARLECHIDQSGVISSIVPVFEMENLKKTEKLLPINRPITDVKAAHLVRSMIQEYIRQSGGEEILEDVIEDIDIFLRKHESKI
jgi:hypothetical protein